MTTISPSDPPLPPSVAVVERVATREGVSPLDLEPLYSTIDPDALDALVDSCEPVDESARVAFEYEGYEVTVTGDGVVHLETDVETEMTPV